MSSQEEVGRPVSFPDAVVRSGKKFNWAPLVVLAAAGCTAVWTAAWVWLLARLVGSMLS